MSPKRQNSPVELRGQLFYLNLALNIFMVIAWCLLEAPALQLPSNGVFPGMTGLVKMHPSTPEVSD